MPENFGPTCAHALNDNQRSILRDRFGRATLPEDSLVSLDRGYLVIEHFNLDCYLELNPELNMELVANGKLHFPV